MERKDVLGVADHDSDPDFDEILVRFDPYIVALVNKLAQASSNIGHPAVLDLEVDEIIQRVRIKFWKALLSKEIEFPQAYIRTIVSNEFNDIPRKRKPAYPLPVDEDGEIYMGNVLVTQSEGMSDPAYEFEQKEKLSNWLALASSVVSDLPSRQQRVIICLLQEQVDNRILLVDAFMKHRINIDSVSWPDDKDDEIRLKASASAARRNLAQRMGVNLPEYKKKGVSDTLLLLDSDDETDLY